MRNKNKLSEIANIDAMGPTLLAVAIQSNSIYCGVLLASIQLPGRCVALGVLRKQEIILINEDPEVYAGDHILAMAAHPMLTPALRVLLQRTHPVYYSLVDCPLESSN